MVKESAVTRLAEKLYNRSGSVDQVLQWVLHSKYGTKESFVEILNQKGWGEAIELLYTLYLRYGLLGDELVTFLKEFDAIIGGIACVVLPTDRTIIIMGPRKSVLAYCFCKYFGAKWVSLEDSYVHMGDWKVWPATSPEFLDKWKIDIQHIPNSPKITDIVKLSLPAEEQNAKGFRESNQKKTAIISALATSAFRGAAGTRYLKRAYLKDLKASFARLLKETGAPVFSLSVPNNELGEWQITRDDVKFTHEQIKLCMQKPNEIPFLPYLKEIQSVMKITPVIELL